MEIVKRRARKLTNHRVTLRTRHETIEIRFPRRDRLTRLVNKVTLGNAPHITWRHRMSLSRKLQIRESTSSRMHKRYRISHLRHTRPLSKPTTIQKHHNRHTTNTMLIPVNLKPATLPTLTPHRSVRQHQRGMRMTEQRWTCLNLIIRKPSSSTNPTTTRVNINAHLTGGFHLNNRVIRVIFIRPNRHKPAPKNQLLFLHDLRL